MAELARRPPTSVNVAQWATLASVALSVVFIGVAIVVGDGGNDGTGETQRRGSGLLFLLAIVLLGLLAYQAIKLGAGEPRTRRGLLASTAVWLVLSALRLNVVGVVMSVVVISALFTRSARSFFGAPRASGAGEPDRFDVTKLPTLE